MDRHETQLRTTLPPTEVRLYDPRTNPELPLLETPLDDRGLVDVHATIALVKSTIEPAYEWPYELSVHHWQWPEANYDHTPYDEVNPGSFRNLPTRKAIVIRSFENWLHLVTEEPPLPDPIIMSYESEAWGVAKDLFKMARRTVQWQKLEEKRRQFVANNPGTLKAEFNGIDKIGEEYMMDVFERNFYGFEFQMERNLKIPEEHRVIEVNYAVDEIAKRLGKLIIPGSANFVAAIRSAA